MARKKKDPCDELTEFAIAEYKAGRLPALPDPAPHRVKSFSLTEADLSFVESVAWSRQVSESAVVRWALEVLKDLCDDAK